MRRTLRQEGLVDQCRLERLRVAIVDDGNSADLKQEAVLISEQLGVPEENIMHSASDGVEQPDFIMLLGDSSPAKGSEVPYCRVHLLEDGFRVTRLAERQGGEPSPLQKPALCTIAACVAWQEALRMTGVILPIEIPKKYLEICMRMDPSAVSEGESLQQNVTIIGPDGKELPYSVTPREDGRGHVMAKIRIEEGSRMADEVFGNLQICCNAHTASEPCHTELRIPRVNGEVSGSATFAGLGGLGSWALHALMGGLRETGSTGEGLCLNLVDPDLSIEEHNLNRQVLYSHEDIRKKKVLVAKKRVAEAFPDATLSAFVGGIGLPHLYSMIHVADDSSPHFQNEDEDEDGIFSSSANLYSASNSIFHDSSAVVCGVDNLRSRTLLNAITSISGIPMLNAGAQGFSGQFDVFMPDESCMLCRYGVGVAREEARMSCQEDGDVPFSSIVTSTAIFGALEGLALLSVLAEGPNSLSNWPSHIGWNGRTNAFHTTNGSYTDPFSDALSSEGPHSDHLSNRILDINGQSHR